MRYTKEKCITESGVRKGKYFLLKYQKAFSSENNFVHTIHKTIVDNIILIMDHDEPLTEEGKCLISCLLQEMDIVSI